MGGPIRLAMLLIFFHISWYSFDSLHFRLRRKERKKIICNIISQWITCHGFIPDKFEFESWIFFFLCACSGAEYVRKEVPLYVLPSSSLIKLESPLMSFTELQRVLYEEERAAYNQAIVQNMRSALVIQFFCTTQLLLSVNPSFKKC